MDQYQVWIGTPTYGLSDLVRTMSIDARDIVNHLQGLDAKTLSERLQWLYEQVPADRLVLASSLGAEDQVLTHALLQVNPKVRIVVLDTGRLQDETYETIAATEKRYDFRYEIFCPNTQAVETMVRDYGINSFYESLENRKRCCHIRKVEPLSRALSTADAWITGIRRGQSMERQGTPVLEWDDAHNALKLNPLVDWSQSDVWDYIHQQKIPYHPLHDQGYPSIGCAPCTRAIKEGESLRAGRWWWEADDQKECGLHLHEKGKVS